MGVSYNAYVMVGDYGYATDEIQDPDIYKREFAEACAKHNLKLENPRLILVMCSG